MKPQSAKAKGRRFQQHVRDLYLQLGKPFGLEPDDIKSTSMGVSGVDLQLSPAAQRLFPHSIECKNVEALNVATVFKKHYDKYAALNTLKLLFHTRNHTEPMVTMRMLDFFGLLVRLLEKEQQPQCHAINLPPITPCAGNASSTQ